MKPELLEKLGDPVARGPLQLEGDALVAGDGTSYPIVRGIPRFVLTEDAGQKQTSDAFGFKWKKRR